MTEYHLYNRTQKAYDDVIRERLLDSNKGYMPQTHSMYPSLYAYIPNFGVDRILRKYLNYMEGTSNLPSATLGGKSFDVSFSQIKSLIESEVVEAGIDHPAMDYLQSMLGNESGRCFLKETMSNGIEPWLKADILLCLAGLEFEGYSDYLFGIAAEALKSDDLRVRDAAVQALEAIFTEAAIWLLKRHATTENVSWLRDYAKQVVEEYNSQK